jgi:hypothetical protein
MQVVPDKGIKNREYSYVTTSGADGPAKFYPENMASIYMRISPTGREVFGAVPEYFGLEGNTGVGTRLGLYASYPLPTLPSKGVKPGDTWGANFQLGALDLQNLYTQKSVVEIVPARGELIGVEWEMGHPCAKIRNTIADGTSSKRVDSKTAKAGDQISDRKVSLEETIWFALDTGVVIKYFRDITVEGKANFGFTSGGAGGAGPQGGAGGRGPTGGTGRGGSADPGDFSRGLTNPGDFQRGDLKLQGKKGGPSGPGALGAPGGPGGPGGAQGPGGGGGQQQGQAAFVRTRYQYLFVLEK